jgi:hypothetical protein
LTANVSDLVPQKVIAQTQDRMTACGGHIRKLENVKKALVEAAQLYKKIMLQGFKVDSSSDIIAAIQASHLSLSSVGYLKGILELLKSGSGSRGSHLVVTDDGIEIHPDIIDPDTKRPLKFKPENTDLRKSIIRVGFDVSCDDLFSCQTVAVRPIPIDRKAFEPAWTDYREGKIYQ